MRPNKTKTVVYIAEAKSTPLKLKFTLRKKNPSQQLDIDHLDSGVYILELQFANTTKSIRFIKE
jgi:hypothetical protein